MKEPEQIKPSSQDLEETQDPHHEELIEATPVTIKSRNDDEIGLELRENDETHPFPTFHNKIFDDKTTQLLVFGLMLGKGMGAAHFYANAARRAGASWKELYTIAEIVSAIAAMRPMKQSAAIFKEMHHQNEIENN